MVSLVWTPYWSFSWFYLFIANTPHTIKPFIWRLIADKHQLGSTCKATNTSRWRCSALFHSVDGWTYAMARENILIKICPEQNKADMGVQGWKQHWTGVPVWLGLLRPPKSPQRGVISKLRRLPWGWTWAAVRRYCSGRSWWRLNTSEACVQNCRSRSVCIVELLLTMVVWILFINDAFHHMEMEGFCANGTISQHVCIWSFLLLYWFRLPHDRKESVTCPALLQSYLNSAVEALARVEYANGNRWWCLNRAHATRNATRIRWAFHPAGPTKNAAEISCYTKPGI